MFKSNPVCTKFQLLLFLTGVFQPARKLIALSKLNQQSTPGCFRKFAEEHYSNMCATSPILSLLLVHFLLNLINRKQNINYLVSLVSQ